MTDEEIRDALVTLKRRTLNVAPLEMTAERHVALIELIIDSEAILRGFSRSDRARRSRPTSTSIALRRDIEADIESVIR